MSGVLNFPTYVPHPLKLIHFTQSCYRYYWITQAFQSTSGSISNLVNGVNEIKTTCTDTTLLGSFLENHDVRRFASLTNDVSLTKNAIAFTMLQDGIPISMYNSRSLLGTLLTVQPITGRSRDMMAVKFLMTERLYGTLLTQQLQHFTSSLLL